MDCISLGDLVEELKGRLFTFGCSFTAYDWPTWADILGRQFSYYENWGQVGAGNQFIFNSLVECIVNKNVNKDDTVIVMWSSVCREDRYIAGRWETHGNIFNQQFYNKNFVKNYVDIRGSYIRDLSSIFAVEHMLTNIGCKFYFLSMMPFSMLEWTQPKYNTQEIEDVLNSYKTTIDKIGASVFEVLFNFNWDSRKFKKVKDHYNSVAGSDWPTFDKFINQDFSSVPEAIVQEINNTSRWNWKKIIQDHLQSDLHPTPLEHLEYIEKVLPVYQIDSATKNWINDIDRRIQQKQLYNDLWTQQKIKRW